MSHKERAFLGIHAACFEDPWPAPAIRDVLAMPGAFGYAVVCSAAAPAGFALGRVNTDEAELLTLAIDPTWRRHGLARSKTPNSKLPTITPASLVSTITLDVSSSVCGAKVSSRARLLSSAETTGFPWGNTDCLVNRIFTNSEECMCLW
jgi:GNAT superfamily N-acetyltransferase